MCQTKEELSRKIEGLLTHQPYVHFSEIIQILKNNTGDNKLINIKNPDEIWNLVGFSFKEKGLFSLMEKTYRNLYQIQVDYQLKNNKLVPKGLALHNEGIAIRYQNNFLRSAY